MKARIYKPSKNAMQSGLARTQKWVVEYEPASSKKPDPLMGWTEAGDTLGQVSVKFDTLDQAKKFADDRGLTYTVLTPQTRRVKPRNFGDNFRYIPPEDEN